MPSKHGIQSSKTPGKEAGAVTKNSTPQRLYDSGSGSGSGSESEGEYENESDSNVNEGPPTEDISLEHSLLASTSELSSDNLFDNDPNHLRKHTKFFTVDVISSFNSQHSGVTDEFILPITSVAQSPPVQVMNRNGGPDLSQTPASSFTSQTSSPTGSTCSGESFFSLQINGESISNQLEGLQSFDLNRSNEPDKFRQPRTEARSSNVYHEEIRLEGLSQTNHPTSHQNDFALPLSFSRTNQKNMDETKNRKKKRKKKKGGACLPGFCCKWPSCHCKFPTCSSKCFSWPSCSVTGLSCLGWPSCSLTGLSCLGWPSCSLKCLSCLGWSSCSSSCSCWPSCCRSCYCKSPSWSCCGSCPKGLSCSWPSCSYKCCS